MYAAKNLKEVKRLNKYAKLSAIVNPDKLSTAPAENAAAKQIITRENPTIKITSLGLEVSALRSNNLSSSATLQQTLTYIGNKKRIVIPTAVLTQQADELANLTTERWLSRLTVPLSIFNTLMILNKNAEDRKIDDYVVLAASAHNIYDYFNGPSVGQARSEFTKMLMNTASTEQVLKKLIEHDVIDNGGMSFLKEWIKNQKSVGIRVGRDGSVILYKNKKTSFGGPYPATDFPPPSEDDGYTFKVKIKM